jgi:hypothetical protein
MAAESHLDEPLLLRGGSFGDVSFWRSCLNLSNVISGRVMNLRSSSRPLILFIRIYDI